MFGRIKQLGKLLDLLKKLGPLLRELFSTAWPILAAIAATVADAYADGTLGFTAGLSGVFGVGLTASNVLERMGGTAREDFRIAYGLGSGPAYAAGRRSAAFLGPFGPDVARPPGGRATVHMQAGVTFPPGPPDSYLLPEDADPDAYGLPPLQLGPPFVLGDRSVQRVLALYKFGPDGVGRWVPTGPDARIYFSARPEPAGDDADADGDGFDDLPDLDGIVAVDLDDEDDEDGTLRLTLRVDARAVAAILAELGEQDGGPGGPRRVAQSGASAVTPGLVVVDEASSVPPEAFDALLSRCLPDCRMTVSTPRRPCLDLVDHTQANPSPAAADRGPAVAAG